ncbi:two-component regulator propeller domain-containing protein [Pontibacter sp. G13]|uniref:hybrid sensor histidine kinase/response regulator transcription factor n=1 Tax=Pontibacter sp. G13 TaxID=3074898 RepID=UPI00288968FB|nr:two-component regulator propeller domain-containing protein [Pontibacter sp. G13]WNJ20123.1 two-component regulator propeller domain-containing protein [Pontibacter sp. G13]
MIRLLRFLLFICLFSGSFAFQLLGQMPIEFRHIDSRQGLSQNSVSAIAQDQDGFMWFGTRAGLNRYDGYQFRTYEREPDSIGGLVHDDIRFLYVDPLTDQIWVGTMHDLSFYRPQTDDFETPPFLQSPKSNPLDVFVHDLLRDQQGNLWAGTSRGLFKFDEGSAGFMQVEAPVKAEIAKFDVRTLHEDPSGTIWVGSGQGLYAIKGDHPGSLDQVSLSDFPELRSLVNAPIQIIKQDHDGRFWIAVEELGLFRWMPGALPKHFSHDAANPNSLTDHDIRTMQVDPKGRLWVGTFSGLHIFDEAIQGFHRYGHELGNPRSLSNGSVRAIAFDSRGSAWVGTYYGGVSYFNPDAYRFSQHQPEVGPGQLSHAVVSSFWEDEQRNIWVGTEGGGLNYWNRSTHSYRHFKHIPGQSNSLSGNNVKTILGQGDSLWIGTFSEGLSLFLPKSNRWKHWRQQSGALSDDNVYDLLLEHGKLWIATYGGGLNVMELSTGKVKVYTPDYQNEGALSSDLARTLMKDQEGTIWIGTKNGLNRVVDQHADELTFDHFLDGRMVCSLFSGRDGSIWVGTYQSGLYRLFPNGEIRQQYDRDHGLPGKTIFAVQEDENGHIWISTERGLAKFHRADESITAYNYSDGLDNLEYNFNAQFRARSGEMFFGGTQGFTSFFPSTVRTNTFVPPVVFTEIRVSNQTVRPGDHTGLLSHSLNETESIELPYNDASITLRFSALDFLNPVNNHYSYWLEGLDQDWTSLRGKGEVSYTLQRSGTYVFHLKGGNSDGIWNQQERRLTITVLPPPWRTTEAYLLYAAVLLLLLVGGYRFIQMRHRLQLERVAISQQESLHQAKLRFYTNITHELRTPLTLILGPIEDLLKTGITTGGERKLQGIQQNAARLLRLVNQLLSFRSLQHDYDEMRVAPGNFVKFVQEVFLSFQEQARVQSIDYQFVHADSAVELWFDRDKMEKVLYNLLSNAFKYTPQHGSICIQLIEQDRNVTVEIQDSGPGVSPKLRPHIFERFVHDDADDEQIMAGTGIGLALAKQLVELHHGQIELVEGDHQGARFRMELPKGKDHFSEQELLPDFKSSENYAAYVEKAHGETEADTLSFASNDPEQPRQSLLIVEDNPQVRSYVQEIFAEHFDIRVAENGRMGLEMAKEHAPDLIISDIMMPVMDGITMCSQLKSKMETSHIPIILLTARTGQIFRVEGLETGADAYLTKPFSPYELKLTVHNLLKTRERIRDRFHTVVKLEPKEITVTSADEIFLTKAIQIVEQYIDDSTFTVEVFAHELAVSRPLLFTKIKAITSQTPKNFVKSLRLKRSAQLLVQTDLGIAEIAYRVGFRDARYYSKCFQKEFEMTPSQYRTQEQSAVAV